jgi:hypothetical protein
MPDRHQALSRRWAAYHGVLNFLDALEKEAKGATREAQLDPGG